jgi:hypothetical protein
MAAVLKYRLWRQMPPATLQHQIQGHGTTTWEQQQHQQQKQRRQQHRQRWQQQRGAPHLWRQLCCRTVVSRAEAVG